jgi:methyltransferase (TIGR00027 family)
MSLVKPAAIVQNGVNVPAGVRFVGVDFNTQSLDVLDEAGFDRARPACFVWEGVTNYLAAQAIDEVLGRIRRCAPGTVLILTYVHREVLEHPESYFGAAKLLSRLRSYGEPWTFGLRPEELKTWLADRGLDLTGDLSAAEIWRDAGRPSAEIRGYEFYRVASAQVR